MRYFFYRQPLYERIWTETVTGVASDLHVATPELKQACLSAAIPWPTSSYWGLLRAGKTPERPPLSRRPPGANCVVTLQRRWSADPPVEQPMLKPLFEETLEETLAHAAPALAAATPAVRRGDFSRIAMLGDKSNREVRSTASPVELRRYQLVADLCSLLEGAGLAAYASTHANTGQFDLRVFASSVALRFWGSEPTAQTLRLGSDDEDQPYADTPGRPMEDRLHEIAATLTAFADKICRARALSGYQRELDSRRREARWRKERADRRRRERAEGRREELLSQAADWRAAANIRGFVAEALAGSPPNRAPETLRGWADWALKEADAIDPCREVRRNPPERRQTKTHP
jgi:hypothetical protein